MRFARNSTIGVKLKTCTSCGKPCYWFSKKRCADCARIEDTQKRMEQATEEMIKEEDLSGLISDADAIFSQFIRLKHSNNVGLCKCFTCPIEKHYTLLQNGHYIKRAHLFLRWDERNCRPQCFDCNQILHGNMGEYTTRLEAETPGITSILQEEMRLVHKPTREEIRQVIADYTPKVKELKKALQKQL